MMTSSISNPHDAANRRAGFQPMIRAFREINNQTDFNLLAKTVLEQSHALFGAEAASLLLVNKNTGDVEIASVRNVPEQEIAAYLQQPARAREVADFFEQADPAGAASLKHPTLVPLALAGYSEHAIWPIRIQGKIIGYLLFAASRPFEVEESARDRVELFLEYIAQAIENAYLIFQLRQQNSHLELMMTKLQNAQNHLRRAEKMALAGKLAATIAHEIRNPLTIIGTTLQWKYEKMDSGDPDRGLMETMIAKVRSMDQIIKELLVFARPLQVEVKPVSLRQAIDRVLVFVEKKFQAKNIAIQEEIPNELPLILTDGEQIQRVFINLLLNAYQAVPRSGVVKVNARQDGARHVRVTFTDNGSGIPQENLSRIFEPFFTTTPEGSGLGLFLVKHILEEMNAEIEVKSEPGAGTEFVLRLPKAD